MPLRHTSRHLMGLLVTGALAALPLAATFAIFWWAARMLMSWVGPDSLIGRGMMALGLGVSGSELFGYVVGIGLVLVSLVLLGALVRTGVQQGASRLLDGALRRIPLVRTVYDLATRLVDLLRQSDREGPKSMSTVWVHFGGVGTEGVAVLGLLSSVEPVMLEGRPHLAVIVPTAPVPVGGGLLFVPAAWVRAADVGMEALTSIYVSMGVTAQQHLARAQQPAAPDDAGRAEDTDFSRGAS
ncbi:DUF502 domain-containing protein [Quisquiliibacterium transsilvanicum]|uniref:Putative membrane protein n=1 Tax=Quisquiliibacterium transsilvanicum TaxID=1549638 RepID=A0A7W8HEJ0_9BURK|nr:DUF502 domain-containing protein [Quisquiliibacterium transsilvanicum]MBB5270453.1 putative membrane protein [Quisquiliibacterium transsilvanicum]